MTRIKDATWESNAITGTDAFTSSTGSPTVDAGSLIKGTYSARTNWTGSTNVNGTISSIASGEIWFSFYIRVAAYPAATARVVTVSNGSTQFNIRMTSTGVLNVRQNATALGDAGTLSLDTLYRIGVHLKIASDFANADAQIQVYITSSGNENAAFGTAVIDNNAITMNTINNVFSSLTLGHNNGAATTGDIYWDNCRVDNVSMPTDDVAGGPTDTPKAVSLTVTDTLSIIKAVGKPFIVTSTISANMLKSIGKPILLSIANTLVIFNNVNKFFSINVTGSITSTSTKIYQRVIEVTSTISSLILKDILKPINISIIVATQIMRNISTFISLVVNNSTDVIFGRGYYRNIDITITNSIVMIAQLIVDKVIAIPVNTILAFQRLITLSITLNVVSISVVQKGISVIKGLISSISLIFSKSSTGITINNQHLNRDIGIIALSFIRSTIAVLGKNTRTVDLEGMKDDSN